MIYEFRSADGRVIERNYDIGTAPHIGEAILVDGVAYKRIFSKFRAQIAPDISRSLIGKKGSKSLPLKWPYAPRHNERGEPVFDSMREVNEAIAKANNDGESVVWD